VTIGNSDLIALISSIWYLPKHLIKLYHFIIDEEKQPHQSMKQLCSHLTNLANIIRDHFKTEEALMRAHDYPGLTEHHREHLFLLAELQECIRDIKAGSKPFSLDTLTAHKHWQINYTIFSDRMFASYLTRQSLTDINDGFST
jgi:hemerythrin-like metal-binding protein